MPHVIAEPCIGVKEKACIEVCPVDAIHTTEEAEQSYINPDESIDCGACASVCPVSAIFPEDELPENMKHFAAKNADFYK